MADERLYSEGDDELWSSAFDGGGEHCISGKLRWGPVGAMRYGRTNDCATHGLVLTPWPMALQKALCCMHGVGGSGCFRCLLEWLGVKLWKRPFFGLDSAVPPLLCWLRCLLRRRLRCACTCAAFVSFGEQSTITCPRHPVQPASVPPLPSPPSSRRTAVHARLLPRNATPETRLF